MAPDRSGSEKAAPAKTLVLDLRAAILDAVRPLDDEGQRQAADRGALGVAQERRHEHRLAGAIDAALGEDVRRRPRPARRGPSRRGR